jgi:rhamnosyl/mannosyltransferase
LVLLEGMSAGCIPVASDLPGLTDVVGEVGYTFPTGDHAALANVLRQIDDNRWGQQSASYDAREWANRFPWNAAARRYQGLFQRLVATRSSAAANFFPLHGPLRKQALPNVDD